MDILLLTQGWRRYVRSVHNPVCQGDIFLSDEISGIQTIGSKKKK